MYYMYFFILFNRVGIILFNDCGYFFFKCFKCINNNEVFFLDVYNLLKYKYKL